LERLDTTPIQLLIISFDQETVKACKQLMPGARVHWLARLAKPNGSPTHDRSAAQIAAIVKSIRADGVGLQGKRDLIDAEFIRELRAGGCDEFHVWTIDSIDDATYYQDLGAIGITTNRPGQIGRAISRTKQLERVE
jgi:glycerophosphoryl diester phosphodiesterase